jgi:hypothetical protein
VHSLFQSLRYSLSCQNVSPVQHDRYRNPLWGHDTQSSHAIPTPPFPRDSSRFSSSHLFAYTRVLSYVQRQGRRGRYLTWEWLAALGADQGIPFVLGHALSLKAIHGGKAKNDKIDSQKSAALLRGGMLPNAYGYPADRRATRDLLSHVQKTTSQYNVPAIGKKIASKANRAGVAARCAAPAVQQTIEVALALIPYYDQLLHDLELSILQTAQQHDAHPLYLLQTVSGLGKLLSLVLLYELHRLDRFPSVQECASYGRLVKCSQEAGGKRLGPSDAQIGHAHRKEALSAAAVLFLRNTPQGQRLLTRVEKKHETGKALRILAPKRAQAVYYMLKRTTAFDLDLFLRPSRSRAGEPGGLTGPPRDEPEASVLSSSGTAFVNAQGHLGPWIPEPDALSGPPLWLWQMRRSGAPGMRVLPLPRA